MEEKKNLLADQTLADVVGGTVKPPLQHTDVCPRCRIASYQVLRTEADGSEVRECKICHFLYTYRKK